MAGPFLRLPPSPFNKRPQSARRTRLSVEALEDRILPSGNPVANPDVYTMRPGTEISVAAADGVLSNDTDVSGNGLIAVLVNGPSNGSLSLSSDGAFTCPTNLGLTGTLSFEYRVFDAEDMNSFSDPVPVTINITEQAPGAQDHSFSVHQGQSLSVPAPGLLDNASDADGDSLSIQLVSQPSNGSVTFPGDGSFVFTPNAGFVGNDSFTVQAFDRLLTSSTATVTIAVTDEAPVVQDHAFSLDHDQTLSIAAPGLLDNANDADGDSLSAQLASPPSNGSVSLAGDGSVVYTPNAGFVGSDSFTVSAFDGALLSNAATVTINVTDEAPVAQDHAFSVHWGQALSIDAPGLLDDATDADGDPLTAQVIA